MGIDIYAKWRGQTKEEEQAQFTGFDSTAGNVGYLREAYHGGPYATKHLVSEAFTGEEAKIPSDTLRFRLPTTVLLAMFRNHKVYGGEDDPTSASFAEIGSKLKKTFENMKDDSHESMSLSFDAESLKTAQKLIEMDALPPYAKSFVDFVNLCERKEKETGEPVTIIASY